MKKWIYAVCVLMLALSVSGCGSSFEPSVTSMYVQKNGKVTYAVVESFEKEYYSLEEFQTMIEHEVEICNGSYSEEYCFAGTVSEALDDGKSFDMLFKDAEYEERTTTEVTEKKDNHVLIVQAEGVIELEMPVKYVSNNVEILSEHTVQVMPIEDESEYAYIIY